MHLNPPRTFENDWKGFADYLGFSNLEIKNFAIREDPIAAVLKEWETQSDSTVGELTKAFDDLGRDDALSELEKQIKIDVERWMKKQSRKEAQPLQVAEVSGSYPNIPRSKELQGITLNDHPGGPVKHLMPTYAIMTYAIMQKLCLRGYKKDGEPAYVQIWRDLVPAGDYNTVTAELIENRCKRMIVVLSPEFVESEKCDFHIKFALSLNPGARNRRMVLVMLKQCEPPPILRFITVCDYTTEALRPIFWPRLYAALNLS